MKYSVLFLFTLITLHLSIQSSFAQEDSDTTLCPTKDISDIIRGDKPKKDKPPKNFFIFLTPVIGSSPATGFIFGAAGQITFKGDPDDKYSIVNANAQYTTKNQALFQVKNNLLLADNKLFASGDYRLFIYSQPTYGLGTDALNEQKSGGGIIIGNESVDPDSIAQPMKYNYVKFYQTVAYNFKGIFYFGGGVSIDIYNHIHDEKLNLAAGDTTFHYSYSVRHGFDTSKYTTIGAVANAIIDTRDNQVNATKGWFVNLNFIANPKLSAAQKGSTRFSGEMRYFKSFQFWNRQSTIAVWVLGTFVTSGEAPYLTLPALGWDQRSRSGRGYAQGTFRGESLAYGEFEYRFPITCNQFLGGVLFVNGTTASDRDRDVRLFRYIQPAFGFGLRLNIDKISRLNLVLDYALGKKSSGFYLNAGETY